MKKIYVLFAALLGISGVAVADHHMKGEKKMDMKMVDANGDGMISKDEFMKHHEMMYEKMKKNKSGMVDMKDMPMMHHDMGKMDMDKAGDKHHDAMRDGKAK